ncbi:hypothetical protein SUGI_0763830 [Cryptomeria japonica]|nr:hypothetical protein SUGI_0763830 [Cryptomeria japonica]
MISGRRNVDMSVKEHTKQYFPIWAATQILNGNMMSVVDERIAIHADVEEVRRDTLASLVCILKDENERPSMAQVILMLQGKMNPDTQQVDVTVETGKCSWEVDDVLPRPPIEV